MEIDRVSPGGECIGCMDARIYFQLVTIPYNGRETEWIEGTINLNPAERVTTDPGSTSDLDWILARNRKLFDQLWIERNHTVRMPRPSVSLDLQEGADLGTMQAITAALVTAFYQTRR